MKLDLGKILKSINKGERPSSDTLYVSSKNDPRLKAYQDSSTLHNLSLKLAKKPGYSFLNDSDGLKVLNNIKRLSGMSKIEPIIGRKNSGTYFKKPERPVAYRKPTVDTVYVDNPNDPRLRAYQDSLKLHNLSLKIANRPNGDISYGRKPEGEFNKNFTAKDAMDYIYSVTPDETTMKKLSRKSKILPTRYYPGEGGGVYFKKPTKPVSYKKPEPKKQDIEQVKKEVLQAIQNKYEGSPVYYPSVGSGGPSALVGFESRQGDTTFIKPEDFDRFAVPKYARQFIQNKSKKK
jgi:hypothetical protein